LLVLELVVDEPPLVPVVTLDCAAPCEEVRSLDRLGLLL